MATGRIAKAGGIAAECLLVCLAALSGVFATLPQGQAALAEAVWAGSGAALAIVFAESTFLDTAGAADARGAFPVAAAIVVPTAGAAWTVAALAALAASEPTALTIGAAGFTCLVATARVLRFA